MADRLVMREMENVDREEREEPFIRQCMRACVAALMEEKLLEEWEAVYVLAEIGQ